MRHSALSEWVWGMLWAGMPDNMCHRGMDWYEDTVIAYNLLMSE